MPCTCCRRFCHPSSLLRVMLSMSRSMLPDWLFLISGVLETFCLVTKLGKHSICSRELMRVMNKYGRANLVDHPIDQLQDLSGLSEEVWLALRLWNLYLISQIQIPQP